MDVIYLSAQSLQQQEAEVKKKNQPGAMGCEQSGSKRHFSYMDNHIGTCCSILTSHKRSQKQQSTHRVKTRR